MLGHYSLTICYCQLCSTLNNSSQIKDRKLQQTIVKINKYNFRKTNRHTNRGNAVCLQARLKADMVAIYIVCRMGLYSTYITWHCFVSSLLLLPADVKRIYSIVKRISIVICVNTNKVICLVRELINKIKNECKQMHSNLVCVAL